MVKQLKILSIEEALQSQLSKQCQEVADAKFQSLIDNGTWELVHLPKAEGQLDVSGYLGPS